MSEDDEKKTRIGVFGDPKERIEQREEIADAVNPGRAEASQEKHLKRVENRMRKAERKEMKAKERKREMLQYKVRKGFVEGTRPRALADKFGISRAEVEELLGDVRPQPKNQDFISEIMGKSKVVVSISAEADDYLAFKREEEALAKERESDERWRRREKSRAAGMSETQIDYMESLRDQDEKPYVSDIP